MILAPNGERPKTFLASFEDGDSYCVAVEGTGRDLLNHLTAICKGLLNHGLTPEKLFGLVLDIISTEGDEDDE